MRTETTVNDSYDFGIGHQVNERLLDAQLEACASRPMPPRSPGLSCPAKPPL